MPLTNPHLLRLPLEHGLLPLAPGATPDLAEERLASRSHAHLLITAPTRGQVQSVARRIHEGGRRKGALIEVPSSELRGVGSSFGVEFHALLERARDGSLLLNDVDTMPRPVQEDLLLALDQATAADDRLTSPRLMAGTTVSLLERVTGGLFLGQLFYRLNLIHLKVAPSSRQAGPSTVR